MTPRLTALVRPLTVAMTAGVVALAVAWTGTSLERSADEAFKQRLEFQVREHLGKSPRLSSELKILAFDDRAVSVVGRAEPSARDWSRLLDLISKQKPRAIVIDKIFSLIDAPDADVKVLAASLQAAPVFVGATSFDHPVPWRDELPTELFAAAPKAAAASGLPATNVYGPTPRIAGAVAGVGHIKSIKSGVVTSQLRSQSDALVPHLGLRAGKTVKAMPPEQLVVNFPRRADLYDATLSLAEFFGPAKRAAKVARLIKPGDTVLILPLFYTGNTDFVETPIGTMPAGFVLASVLNDTLTEAGLKRIDNHVFWTALAGVAGVVVSMALGPVASAAGMMFLIAGVVAAGFLAFSHGQMQIPWLSPLFFIVLGGIAGGFQRYVTQVNVTRRIRASFSGLLPEAQLQLMADDIDAVRRKPTERLLTIMFIDVVGFSLFADRHDAGTVFNSLRAQLAALTRKVHEFHGIVDKSLGDGMLCYFGYDVGNELTSAKQADEAIACAIAMQRDNIDQRIRADGVQQVLSLRIGIHTAAVYVGDLGDKERIDFTIIGTGVNFAKRLESACEPGHVLVSPTTVDMAKVFSLATPGFHKRSIAIKHYDELFEAIQCDPLAEAPALRDRWKKSIEHLTPKLENREMRWPALAPVACKTTWGQGVILDFSRGGLSLQLDRYLAKDVSVAVLIADADPEMAAQLHERGLDNIKCAVRWGRPRADQRGFVHGLIFLHLNASQSEYLLEYLKKKSLLTLDPRTA